MSLLGKILLVLNVLAAIAFFFVASFDWAKRAQWADATIQHELMITGLPLDQDEKDLYGSPRVRSVSKSALDQLFQKAGGQPVKTQDDELTGVKNRINSWVSQADTPAARVKRLAEALHALAPSSKERRGPWPPRGAARHPHPPPPEPHPPETEAHPR